MGNKKRQVMNENHSKSWYIQQISKASETKQSEKLLHMMDLYGASSLKEIDILDVINYYKTYILGGTDK